MLSCGITLITEQDQTWWKESSRTAPHLTQLSSDSTVGSPATRAFGQQAPVAAVSSVPYMAWFSRFLKKNKCCLLMETSLSSARSRAGPVYRKDVTRQNPNQLGRVTHTRERPVHSFTPSLPPVRGVERKPTSVKKNTHDRPHRATKLHPEGALSQSCSRLNFQTLRTSVRTNSSQYCQNTNHCLTHTLPSCTTGPALQGTQRAIPDVTHLPDLGHTASAARDLMPRILRGAMPTPAALKLAHGQNVGTVETRNLLGVTSDDSEPSATLRGLAQAFPHHSHCASRASSRVDPQVGGPSGDTKIYTEIQEPSPKQRFGLHVRKTNGRLGRDDKILSVSGKK